MEKVIYNTDNDALTESVRKSGKMLTEILDLDTGVKSASSEAITRSVIEQFRPKDPSKALVHHIAMGASDYYGFNKNGDWFDESETKPQTHTFVDVALPFREHNNKDAKDSIGSVKYAAYCDSMHRVELLVELDREKAQEEFEMMKSGKELCWSMSCRVAHDVCNCCGNIAKRASEYCDHLIRNMGMYVPEFKKYAYAKNIKPVFFDISRVGNPADRQARELEILTYSSPIMEKAASVRDFYGEGGKTIPSAWRALASGGSDRILSVKERSIVQRLADGENFLKNASAEAIYEDVRLNLMACAAPFCLCDTLDSKELEAYRSVEPDILFHHLAKRACVLSFPAFCEYYSGTTDVVESPGFYKAAMEILPSIFQDMAGGKGSQELMDMFSAASPTGMFLRDTSGDFVQNIMDDAERKFCIKSEPVKDRVTVIIMRSDGAPDIKGIMEKMASVTKESSIQGAQMAIAYGHYQVRALMDIAELCGEGTVRDIEYDLLIGSNSAKVFDR